MFSSASLTASRVRRGFTRSQLHHELVIVGIRRCRSLIDHWESGKSEPRASEIEALSRVLDVPLSDFFVSTHAAPGTP